MKSLFIQQEKDEIINRINKLTPETKALWGKMNVSQMLAHAQKPLEVAVDPAKLDKGIMSGMLSLLFGKTVKNKLLKNDVWKKGSPTAPGFKINDERDFDKEKQRLIEDINKFSEIGRGKKLGDRHPFFGKMTPEEWDLLQWKHLDHHLKQFGA